MSDGYGLDREFEHAAVTLLCTNDKLWKAIGTAMDPDALTTDPGKLALRAAQQVAKDIGAGPGSTLVVLQRLRAWQRDGKAKQEDIYAVLDMFDDAEDDGLPSADAVLGELQPLLRRRKEHSGVMEMIEAHGKRQDLQPMIDKLLAAQRLGQVDEALGVRLGLGSFGVIDSIRNLERLPTDVPEIDQEIGGGPPRKTLSMFMGGSGDGKSMCLSHVTAAAMLKSLRVAYATLELSEAVTLARIKANLTAIPIDVILNGDNDECKKKIAQMLPQMGACIVKEFTPHATTHQDVIDWVADVEKEDGQKIDVLVVDYGDKLAATHKNDIGSYETGRIVFEGLRVWAVDHNAWCWTASQTSRGKDKNKNPDLDNTADSMNKPRVADLVITLRLSEEADMLTYFIAKNRHGKARQTIGPLPHEFEMGRVASVQRITDNPAAFEAPF